MEVVEICQEGEERIEIADEHSGQGQNEEIKTVMDPRDYQPLCQNEKKKTPMHPRDYQPLCHKIFLFCCVVAASLDPLFFYIPIIDDQKKCLAMDEKLKKAVLVLRLVMDLTYIFHIAFQIYSGYIAPPSESKGSSPKSEKVIDRTVGVIQRINWRVIIINVLCVLPIPQVVILVYFHKMRGSELLNWRKFLNFIILLQFVPRIFRIYHSCKELTKKLSPSKIARAMWVKGLFNFFLYIIAIHVFGATWYLFSVQRELECWQQACKGNSMCSQSTLLCKHRNDIVNDPIIGYLNRTCPLDSPSRFDFGIFTPALQSGVVNSMDFPKKFFYCFAWGLRNLSSFGSNLKTSTYFWESLFSAAITVIGLLLFNYLIGNFQTYLQLNATDSENCRKKMEKKEGEVDKWMKSYRIPPTLRKKIMDSVAQKLPKIEEVNLTNLLQSLPTQCNKQVKQHLCQPILKKIDIVRADDNRPKRVGKRENEIVDALYDYLIPESYIENECIFQKGESLDKIIMIIQGQIRIERCDGEHCEVNNLKEGQLYGVDLLDWALPTTPMEQKCSSLPASTETVTAYTKVEAFALRANDFRYLIYQYLLLSRKELEHNPESSPSRSLSLNSRPSCSSFCFALEVLEICQTREERIEIADEHYRQGQNEKIKTLMHPRDYQPLCHKIFLFFCVVAASLDPLFFYIPIIDDKKKCLAMDENLKKVVLVLRSVMDLTYIFHIAFQIYSDYIAPPSESKGSSSKSEKVIDRTVGVIQRINWRVIIINVLCVLPIPQVVILVYFPKMRGSESLNWRKLLNFVIFLQFVPRIFRIYHSCKELPKKLRPTEIARATWVKGLFNLFLYIIASHLFGAMWYLFSVQRDLACWQHACKGNSMCSQSTLLCKHRNDIVNDPIIGYLSQTCPLDSPSRFDFGLFTPALQSGVVNLMDFTRKLFYCFAWGLRNLSSFGSNLETSTYFWESLFSAAITVIGLLLFIYLIGNLQTYLQFSATDSENCRRKMEKIEGEVEKWMKSHGIPRELRKKIKDSVAQKLPENEEVNLKNLLQALPTQSNKYIKQHLCQPILKKNCIVRAHDNRPKRVRKIENQIVDALYDYLIPKSYIENAYIFQKGKPLDKIIMIIQGQIRIERCDGEHCEVNNLKEGQLYWEDLLYWALSTTPLELEGSSLPASRETVRADTKVEAFILSANDFRNLIHQYLKTLLKELEHNPEYMDGWASSAVHILRVALMRYVKEQKRCLNQTDKEGGDLAR